MTPIFCCGFECGLLNTGHYTLASGTAPTISTTTVRSGFRSMRVNLSAQTSITTTFLVSFSSTISVHRFYLRFATLPDADTTIAGFNITVNSCGLRFIQSESKIYCRTGANNGATGISVTTGVWYLVDLKIDQTGGAKVVDAKIDGVDLGQATSTEGTSGGGFNLGSEGTVTGEWFFDDYVGSNTSGDYPIGAGKIEPHVCTADGVHNISGTGDFQRGNTGVDILNATTTAWQLVDDVPLPSGAVDQADCWRGVAPANPTTDYVEGVFGPAPGISAPTTAPRAVEVILAHHQIATTSGQMTVRLNDNGTVDDIFNTGAAAGVTTYRYARKHYASGPAGAWVIGGGGNGDFTDLRCRFLAQDANPDQCLDAIMIEAEFSEAPVVFIAPKPYQVKQAVNRASTY